MDDGRDTQKIIASFIVILAVVVVTFGLKWHNKHELSASAKNAAATMSPAAQSTPAATSTNTANATANYKDGTYTADAQYYVPDSTEQISVTLTLKNGVITDSAIKNSESDPTSAQFQEDFASSYKSHVVGKNIGGLNVQFIAGASETSKGFNDALQRIASQAKA